MSLLAARLREAQAATAPAEVGLVLSQPSLPSDRQVAPARRPYSEYVDSLENVDSTLRFED